MLGRFEVVRLRVELKFLERSCCGGGGGAIDGRRSSVGGLPAGDCVCTVEGAFWSFYP